MMNDRCTLCRFNTEVKGKYILICNSCSRNYNDQIQYINPSFEAEGGNSTPSILDELEYNSNTSSTSE